MSKLDRIKLMIAVAMLTLSGASVGLSALQYASSLEGQQESTSEAETDGRTGLR